MKPDNKESNSLIEYIQKCLNDKITIDPYLSLSFPEHQDELRSMFAAFPRQGFSRDFATVPAIIRRTTNDGEITVEWAMQMPRFDEKFEAVAELFFRIETFIIRPKIKKLIAENELSRAIEIGTLSDIANSLSADETERNLIQKALVFGSNILLDVKITRQPKVLEFDNGQVSGKTQPPKKQEQLTSVEDKIFRYFDVYVLDGISIISSDERNEEKVENENQVVIVISPQYAMLIEASLDTPGTGEAIHSMLQISAIPLRILELIHCSKLLGIPPFSEVGKDMESIELSYEDMSELIPMKNSNKMNQLIGQLMRKPLNPENN